MASQPKTPYTPETYLEMDRGSEFKNEYFNGEIFAMTGASRKHSLITFNIALSLGPQLKGRQCEAYVSDMRVKVRSSGLYTYPDVIVICAEPEFEDEQKDTLLNPTLIVEVLSESTEAYDRGKKFEHYQTLKSLSDYILVAQETACVECYIRQGDGNWLYSAYEEIDDTIELASVRCALPLSEVYDKVEF